MNHKLMAASVLISCLLSSVSSYSGWSNPWAYVNYIQNKWSATRNHIQNVQLDKSLLNQIEQIDAMFKQLKAMKAKLNVKDLIGNSVLWDRSLGNGESDEMSGTAEVELEKYRQEQRKKYGKPAHADYFRSKGQDEKMAEAYEEMNVNAEDAVARSKRYLIDFNKVLAKQIVNLKNDINKSQDGDEETSVAEHMAIQNKILLTMLAIQIQMAKFNAIQTRTMGITQRVEIEGRKSQVKMYNNGLKKSN